MNLYVVRHGEVVKKYLHRYISTTDIGLSGAGKQQAKKLSDFLSAISFDVVYMSPRKRAIQTAAPLLMKKKIQALKDSRVAEIDLGPWEGKTSRQVKRMLPKDIACEKVTSGGELYSDFQKRVRTFLADIRQKHTKDTVAVVTHKGVVREMYKVLLQDESLIVDQDYGAINHFFIEGNTVTVKRKNYRI